MSSSDLKTHAHGLLLLRNDPAGRLQLRRRDGEPYDARAELIWIGADAIPAIVDGLPFLGGFGQLTAIEAFEEVGDPRRGPALIGLLDSDDPTVRE